MRVQAPMTSWQRSARLQHPDMRQRQPVQSETGSRCCTEVLLPPPERWLWAGVVENDCPACCRSFVSTRASTLGPSLSTSFSTSASMASPLPRESTCGAGFPGCFRNLPAGTAVLLADWRRCHRPVALRAGVILKTQNCTTTPKSTPGENLQCIIID